MTEDQNQKVDRTDQNDRQWPTGTWIAIGIALGVGFGVAVDNLSSGIAVGLTFGIALDLLLAKGWHNR